MPPVTEIPGRPVPERWYAELQGFYAGHVRHRDEGAVADWLAALDDDAELTTNVFSARRAELGEAMRWLDEQPGQAGLRRRHLLSTFVALRQPDDTVVTRYYALVVAGRPGERPAVHSTSVACDVLARSETGEWRVRRREIMRDDLPRPQSAEPDHAADPIAAVEEKPCAS